MPQSITTVRRNGRPSTLSRELILQAGLDVARSAPNTPVSISAIARALGVTPMALYTYFGNRDELMQALSARLLAGLFVDMPPNATPIEQVFAWAHAVRNYCLEHPQIHTMLMWEGGHSSTAWLNFSQPLFDAAQSLGFTGARQGLVMLWLWNSVMGAVRFEAHLLQTGKTAVDDEEALAPEVRNGVRLVRMVADSEEGQGLYFDFQLERIADTLIALS